MTATSTPEPVAEQWRVLENGSPRTSWRWKGEADEARWRDFAEADPDHDFETRSLYPASTIATLTAERDAATARIAELERDMDGGRFDEWSDEDLAGQCRMQARDNLDPEYSQFMAEVAKRFRAATALASKARGAALEEAAKAAESDGVKIGADLFNLGYEAGRDQAAKAIRALASSGEAE